MKKDELLLRFDTEKSPIGYAIGFVEEDNISKSCFNHKEEKLLLTRTMMTGFMSDYTFSIPRGKYDVVSKKEHLDFMRCLRAYYETKESEGVERVINQFRVDEIDFYFGDYDELSQTLSKFWFRAGYERGFFIGFPASITALQHTYSTNPLYTIIYADCIGSTTLKLMEAHNLADHDTLLRKLDNQMIATLGNVDYYDLSISKKRITEKM